MTEEFKQSEPQPNLKLLSVVIPARDEEGCICSTVAWGDSTSWPAASRMSASVTLRLTAWITPAARIPSAFNSACSSSR